MSSIKIWLFRKMVGWVQGKYDADLVYALVDAEVPMGTVLYSDMRHALLVCREQGKLQGDSLAGVVADRLHRHYTRDLR